MNIKAASAALEALPGLSSDGTLSTRLRACRVQNQKGGTGKQAELSRPASLLLSLDRTGVWCGARKD